MKLSLVDFAKLRPPDMILGNLPLRQFLNI